MIISVELILNGIILTLSSMSFLLCIFTLVIVFIHNDSLLLNIPILLICNTYLTILFGSVMMLIIYGYSINSDLHPTVLNNDYSCQLRGYFLHVFICAFYYSCVLQAIFRLLRIVFNKQMKLQSHYSFFIGIFIQWFISFLYILVHLLNNYYEYSSIAHGCWISFKNVSGLSQALIVMYFIPILTICIIYAYIIRYTRKTVHIQQQRRTRNKRDLLILKRIVIIVLVAMGIGIATLITLIIYVSMDYLVPQAYHLQGLCISGGFLTGSIGFIFISPQIREILKKKRQQIRPLMILKVVHQSTN